MIGRCTAGIHPPVALWTAFFKRSRLLPIHRPIRSKISMQPARFERMMGGFVLVIGLTGFMGGCGPGGQVSPEEAKASAKAIESDNQNFYPGVNAKKSAGPSPNASRTKGRGPGSSAR
jgi:hypothetical protein